MDDVVSITLFSGSTFRSIYLILLILYPSLFSSLLCNLLFKGAFKMTAEGDLTLKADKVNFDGFRILLTRQDEEFAPRVWN